MTTFTVWKFDEVEGAGRAESCLEAAQTEGIVTVVDHAVLSWPAGADEPDLRHDDDSPKRGAAWGAMWGILGGALFAIPVAGLVLGAGLGALARAAQDTGITHDDLSRIRAEVTPGTSALFLVTEDADLDRLGERLRSGAEGTLIARSLAKDESLAPPETSDDE